MLSATSAWLDTLVGTIGELKPEDAQELFCRIQLDELPVVLFQDPEGFSKWVVALDERQVGKPLANCYWLESGFFNAASAARWAHNHFAPNVNIEYVGKIQLHSPIN
jgi:hypothetical protein